jgi:hypothetical protein
MSELPRPRFEGIWFGCEGADGAKIDDVARQFRIEILLEVGADL